MRIAVTGGAGFIGSHLVEALVAQGSEVHIVDCFYSAAWSKEQAAQSGAVVHAFDCRAQLLYDHIKPDVIYHLAGQTDVGSSVRDPHCDMQHNVGSMLAVLRGAQASNAKVIFTSTAGVMYGNRHSDAPASEGSRAVPCSPYGVSKLCAETYAEAWDRMHGIETVVLRLGNVYGPRQSAELEGGVVARFIDTMLGGQPLPPTIYGDGKQTRDFVYVEDVVDALRLAVAGRGVYNICSGTSTSIGQLYAYCAAITGYDGKVQLLPARDGEIRHTAISPGRARVNLGWQPRTSLNEGLRATFFAALR